MAVCFPTGGFFIECGKEECGEPAALSKSGIRDERKGDRLETGNGQWKNPLLFSVPALDSENIM